MMAPIAGLAAPPKTRRSPWGSLKLRLALIGGLLIAASAALTVTQTLRVVNAHDEQVAIDLSMAHTRKMAKLISARLVGLQVALRSSTAGLEHLPPLDGAAALALLENRPALAALFDTLFISLPDGHLLAYRDEQGVRVPKLFIGDRNYFKRTLQEQRSVIRSPSSAAPRSSPS